VKRKTSIGINIGLMSLPAWRAGRSGYCNTISYFS